MSSYEMRRNDRNGTESHRVRFRLDGKNRAVTFTSEAAARSWMGTLDLVGPARALALLEDERPQDARAVVDQMRHHVAHLTNVTDGTRRRYEQMIEGHFVDHLGSTLLTDLTRDHVTEWVVNQRDAATKTARNRHALLSAALTRAVEDGLVPANVAKGIKIKGTGKPKAELTFLTPGEYAAIRAEIGEHWRPLADFLVGTGVRWGEATALAVRDVDIAGRSARIRQAWKETTGNGAELGAPKTRKSLRTIALPGNLLPTIEQLCAGRGRDEFVFVGPRGGVVRDWWREDVWYPAVARALPRGKRPRVHDLRHTFASWAIQGGIPLPVIQRQMGHESITTTVDTYGHLVRSDFDPLADLVERNLRQAITPTTSPAGTTLSAPSSPEGDT